LDAELNLDPDSNPDPELITDPDPNLQITGRIRMHITANSGSVRNQQAAYQSLVLETVVDGPHEEPEGPQILESRETRDVSETVFIFCKT
jgi:hypothetical protein